MPVIHTLNFSADNYQINYTLNIAVNSDQQPERTLMPRFSDADLLVSWITLFFCALCSQIKRNIQIYPLMHMHFFMHF